MKKMTERKQLKEMGGDWRSRTKNFILGRSRFSPFSLFTIQFLSEFSSSSPPPLRCVIFRFFFRTVFFIRAVVKAYSHPFVEEYLGSQDELSNYLSWKIPRISRVYLQLIDLSDNKPDAWFIFKTRQYVK